MPKILLIDTYYPDFLRTISLSPHATYETALREVLDTGFGTSDFYSRHLRNEGWEAVDIIANFWQLQWYWAREHGLKDLGEKQILLKQIEHHKPDVVFFQDLSYLTPPMLAELGEKYLLAGQCSCPMPSVANVSQFHTLFTSFPHYVEEFTRMGVKAEYLPLAFEASMLSDSRTRDIDICFVGGVGARSHWKAGTEILEAVAKRFGTRFSWYGYGMDNLSPDSPLRKCWRGFAWGKQLYARYAQAKIVVNRHGEVARKFTNNLRCYEATGMGAMLMTEASPNLEDLFPQGTCSYYYDSDDLCAHLDLYLSFNGSRQAIADAGQAHTLANHTYQQRMKQVSEVLNERLGRI